MRPIARLLAASITAAVTAVAPAARAFSTASAFSDPCHETMTIAAFEEAAPVLPIDAIDLPERETWDRAAGVVFEAIGEVETANEHERFFFFSLFLGVRAPDTEGSSSTNVQTLRGIHAHPEGQYDHCLRATEDDGARGDASAHQACLATIRSQIEQARDALDAEEGGAIVLVPFTLDHYGTFDVPVWGAAYHIGRALHAVQDSFTHTVRSDDLTTIYHVANFIEAVDGTLEERRDGLAHSTYADQCGEESSEVVRASREASADLLRATATFLDGTGDGEGAIEAYLATWMPFQEGCGIDRGFCGSKWEERARREPTTAYLGCAVAGPVGARPDRGGSTWQDRSVAVLGLLLAALVARRGARRRASTAA